MKLIILLLIALATASAQTTINARAITVSADGVAAFNAWNQTPPASLACSSTRHSLKGN